MKKIDIIFFGTSNFAEIILENLVSSPICNLKLVVTQPDKPVSRKKILTPSPVKVLGEKNNIQISQPAKLDSNFTKYLQNYNADLFIVVDYGKIIPNNVINIPKFKTINIHPSLLPIYRGPSPIQTALLNGEAKTGISIMLIDQEMDHGPILAQTEFPIESNDTYPMLLEKLAQTSAELLTKTIHNYIEGKIKPTEQNHLQATFTKIIDKHDGLITPDKTADTIYNMYRAYTPWPGIYLESGLKLLDVETTDKKHDQKPLDIFSANNNLYLACDDDTALKINRLQPPGKKEMNAKSYINGYLK